MTLLVEESYGEPNNKKWGISAVKISCDQLVVQGMIKESLLHGLFDFILDLSSSRQVVVVPLLGSKDNMFHIKFDNPIVIERLGKKRIIYTEFPEEYDREDLTESSAISFHASSEDYYDMERGTKCVISFWLLKKKKKS